MDHFPPGDWIDRVRDMLPPERAALMQSHLDQACEECHSSSETWRLVAKLTSREAAYEPPEEVVRIVEAAYRSAKPGTWLSEIANFARLVFDSFKQPSLAAVRSGAHSSRQLVHESEPFTVDLRLESDPARKRIYLMGQILNSKNPGGDGEGIDIVLLHGSHLVKRTLANAAGEFDLDFGSEDDMQLFINIRGQRAIGIVLPNLEG